MIKRHVFKYRNCMKILANLSYVWYLTSKVIYLSRKYVMNNDTKVQNVEVGHDAILYGVCGHFFCLFWPLLGKMRQLVTMQWLFFSPYLHFPIVYFRYNSFPNGWQMITQKSIMAGNWLSTRKRLDRRTPSIFCKKSA